MSFYAATTQTFPKLGSIKYYLILSNSLLCLHNWAVSDMGRRSKGDLRAQEAEIRWPCSQSATPWLGNKGPTSREGVCSNIYDGPSTRRRALKLQRCFPFTLNGVTSRFVALHCGSVASLCLRCLLQKLRKVQLVKLRRKRQPIKSYASTSSSQSNRVLVCPGQEFHVIGCWSSFRHARRQASTHAAVWTLRDKAAPCAGLKSDGQLAGSQSPLQNCFKRWSVAPEKGK